MRAAGLLLVAFLGCGTPVTPELPKSCATSVCSVADGLATTGIDGKERFIAMAYRDGGLLLPGATLKFLIDARDAAAPIVYFMNSNFTDPDGTRPDAAKYHFHLAERVIAGFDLKLAEFNAVTYDTQDKDYIAGSIQTYYVGKDPEPLYGIQFFPQDLIHDDKVVEAVRLVVARFEIEGARLGFVATGKQQVIGAEQKAALETIGVAPRTLDDVLGDIDFLPLNRGEAWGFLRMFPKDPDALSASDIPVFDELPLDLSVVAGTITRAYQDPTSHVNLKSKERGTPNMVLRSAGPDHAELSPWIDKPVHLTVAGDRFVIEAASEADIQARIATRRAKPWLPLPYTPTDALLSYVEMCRDEPAHCLALTQRYGGKASSLGFLTNAKVLGRKSDKGSLSARYGYDVVPAGFGLPFKFYRDFVMHEPNAQLRAALSALIDDEKRAALSPLELAKRSEAVRELFYAAQFPPGMVERVLARVAEVLPGQDKIKVRSSANAEDMPNFDGAGLYTSFGANLTKTDEEDGSCKVVLDEGKLKVKPKTMACAIKGVFASVWNKRAIEERTHARLDHAHAMMGIAVVADYDLAGEIAANSVVVTRVINSENVYGYTFATQRGNALVTNPEPGTLAENVIAAFNGPGDPESFAVTRYAVPVAGQPALTTTVLSDKGLKQLLEITRTAEIAYCNAREDYYAFDCTYAPSDPKKARALDYELKYYADGRFLCKQMREFSGR